MRPSEAEMTISCDRNSTPHEDTIIRRFPRVGTQFQTRISKATGLSIRPTPERMSSDFPYLSEVEAGQRKRINDNVSSGSRFGAIPTYSGFDSPLSCSKSNRGGLLIHKPSQEQREFSIYTHPLMISTRSEVRPKISNEAWVQHMIHLHSTKTIGKRNRACRGGRKRKRVENEELIWSLENVLDRLHNNRSGTIRTEIVGEEEALALEHLYLFFDGNIDAAEFNLLVKLSGGQATKMRKREEKERTKRRSKFSSQQTSESWRDMYQSSTCPYVRTILGQLQDDTEPLYQLATMATRTPDGALENNTAVNLALEPEDSKGAWRSILACGKSIERQLNSEIRGLEDKKPLLSTLLTFVSKAYALPTPESCFGTHHVIIEEISNTIISILSHVKRAQHVHAKIRDKIFDESQVGIDSDDLLKFLDIEYNALPIRLREVDKLNQFRDIIVQWESRLVEVLAITEDNCKFTNAKNSLYLAEKMQKEARGHGYRSKALVQLTVRINKAYDLRDRILRWKYACTQGKMTTIKTVSGFVKEAKRIKLFSPEMLDIFECYRLTEEWIDRANIAIRSKISLDEIKSLIQRGEEISLDLSEYMHKLKTRARIADEWLQALDEIVPSKDNGFNRPQIWRKLQLYLQNGNDSRLHELSSEGNRIPVDIVPVKLLQLAIDAKNWSTKAQKWIPNNGDSKRGKLGDLREHMGKISSLRDKLPLQESERKGWKPAGENELSSIIIDADSWVAKYKVFLLGDNRKGDKRCCLSISKLRTIVEEGNAIYANIGNSMSKISRILVQAENWYHSHLPLLQHCRISLETEMNKISTRSFISIHEISAAVESARADVALDLDEAIELRNLLEKSKSWNERVALIAPRRNKRHSRGVRSRFRLKDLIDLVEEASDLPIDTDDNVNRLQNQLNTVETWRLAASKKLKDVLFSFQNLKDHVDDVYGAAKEYNIDRISVTKNDQHGTTSSTTFNSDVENTDKEMGSLGKRKGQPNVESILGSQEDNFGINRGSNSALGVFRLVKELKEESRDISVITTEGEVGEILDTVSKWLIKSFKYLNNPREVFDKRFFGAFDRFIIEGEDLFKISCNVESYTSSSDKVNERLFCSWGSFVNDQLARLAVLKRERKKFEFWCERAIDLLSDEKRLTAEKLADLAKNSLHFPANRDLVSKIRGLSVKVSKWTTTTKNLLESGERIDMQDARNLVETGEKLKVQSQELKQLRAQVRAARNWSIRAKKCNTEQVSIHVDEAKQLIEEHHKLLIEMPDDLENLKQATIGYCICRRPYDGFMIGCDHCEEWYHGSCIGISESKADRVEKFTCIRCSTKNVLKSSAATAVGIVRKWTCPKDLKKARQVEYQKLQRKDRKEKKDIEKFSSDIKRLEEKLSDFIGNEQGSITFESEEANLRDFAFKSELTSKNKEKDGHFDGPSDILITVGNKKPINPMNDGCIYLSNGIPVSKNSKDTQKYAEDQQSGNISKPANIPPTIAGSDNAKIKTSGTSEVVLDKGEIMFKLDKAKASLQLSKERLKKISHQSEQITLIESKEDRYALVLRNWCLKVKAQVLAPTDETQSEKNRPSGIGIMPSSMQQVLSEAEQEGVLLLPDVEKMAACFKSMCWSFSAMEVLRHKPSISELRTLILEASKFKLPDEKALRTMKYMTNKASQLQLKIKKALTAKKGEAKPIDLSMLKELQSGIRESPLLLPEEKILHLVIADNGSRHCVCGGPRDGNEIFFCNFCEKKFHAACINKIVANGTSKLICPCCEKEGNPSGYELKLEKGGVDREDYYHPSFDSENDVSPHAPNPIELWPPFGKNQSQAAIEAFGHDCLAQNGASTNTHETFPKEDDIPKSFSSQTPVKARGQDGEALKLDNSVCLPASI